MANPRPPFLSDIVKGSATQITPNGRAYDKQPSEGSPTGHRVGGERSLDLPAPLRPAQTWPGGNRSGE